MTVHVWFKQPADRLSLNDRMHWAPKAKLTAAWREAARIAARESLTAKGEHAERCTVRVTFPVTQNRRRDPHNAIATVKPIVDGFVDAGVWPDDTDEWVIVLDPRFDKRNDGIVTVDITPMPETAA